MGCDSAEWLGWQQLLPPYVPAPHSCRCIAMTLTMAPAEVFKSTRAAWVELLGILDCLPAYPQISLIRDILWWKEPPLSCFAKPTILLHHFVPCPFQTSLPYLIYLPLMRTFLYSAQLFLNLLGICFSPLIHKL